MKYQVAHTVDGLGGRYPGGGIVDTEVDSLAKARRLAARLTAVGQCGYIVRVADGAIEMPDGSWFVPKQ